MEPSTIVTITSVVSILTALTATTYGFINHYQKAQSDSQKTFIIKLAFGLVFYLTLGFALVFWLQSSMAVTVIVMTVPAFIIATKTKYKAIRSTVTS